jgi:hypothetical protein
MVELMKRNGEWDEEDYKEPGEEMLEDMQDMPNPEEN